MLKESVAENETKYIAKCSRIAVLLNMVVFRLGERNLVKRTGYGEGSEI